MNYKNIAGKLKNTKFIIALYLILIIISTILPPQMLFWYKVYYMPIIGGLGLLVFKKRWYLAPVLVFAVSTIALLAMNLINLQGFNNADIVIQLGFFNAVASFFGSVIGLLLRFAFKKNSSYEFKEKPVKKDMTLRITTGILTIAFISFSLFVINGFIGNPVISAIAEIQIRRYVNENYKEQDLILSDPIYNFVSPSYNITASSKTKEDLKFGISYNNGRVSDDYDTSINSGENTLKRLAEEFKNEVTPLLKDKFGPSFKNCTIGYFKENEFKNLELNIKFDKSLPLTETAYLHFSVFENSAETLSNTIREIHSFLYENGYIIEYYHFTFDSNKGKDLTEVSNITPQSINVELSDIIFAAQSDSEKVHRETGIIYFYKSVDK